MLTKLGNVINYYIERGSQVDKKELFLKTINTLEELTEFRSKASDLIRGLKCVNTDFMGEDTIVLPAEHLIIELLAAILASEKPDKIKNIKSIIEWWLYDTSCGKDDDYNEVSYSDGEIIKIDTPEKLWEDIQKTLE